jgi:predicted aspartyl protease
MVAGQPTAMLVDTGANSHVIAGWFARKAGLTLARLGDIGTDHAGRTIATARVEHPKVAIDGWGALADGPMLVTDVPPIIEKLGIGAFISPQRLTEDGDAVILDLAGGEVRAAIFEDALRAEGFAGATLVGEGARACEDTESVIKGLAFVVPTVIDGQRAELLVDTGAQRSDLLLASAAGQALAGRSIPNKEQMYGASGRLSSRTVKGARLHAGDLAYALDVDLIGGESDPYCPRDGVLSMDVLRSCVLVLGRRKIAGRCAPAGR